MAVIIRAQFVPVWVRIIKWRRRRQRHYANRGTQSMEKFGASWSTDSLGLLSSWVIVARIRHCANCACVCVLEMGNQVNWKMTHSVTSAATLNTYLSWRGYDVSPLSSVFGHSCCCCKLTTQTSATNKRFVIVFWLSAVCVCVKMMIILKWLSRTNSWLLLERTPL